jgi:hypothetical protein
VSALRSDVSIPDRHCRVKDNLGVLRIGKYQTLLVCRTVNRAINRGLARRGSARPFTDSAASAPIIEAMAHVELHSTCSD